MRVLDLACAGRSGKNEWGNKGVGVCMQKSRPCGRGGVVRSVFCWRLSIETVWFAVLVVERAFAKRANPERICRSADEASLFVSVPPSANEESGREPAPKPPLLPIVSISLESFNCDKKLEIGLLGLLFILRSEFNNTELWSHAAKPQGVEQIFP